MRPKLLIACVAITACGGASRNAELTTSPSNSLEGVYQYSATIPGYQPGKTLRVQGTLTVVGDSLFVQPDSGCVLYQPTRVGQEPIRAGAATLNCGGASLNFTRRNLKSGTWYSVVQVPKQRNTCVQYEPRDAARSPRCIRSRPETYYESQRRSGVVQIRLIQ
jgi:hypothetical protein